MADAKNDPKSGQNIKRRVSDPYAIHLDNEEYTLTEEILQVNVDSRTLKQRTWHFPDLKFISFNDGTLELQNTYNNISHKLTIVIEKSKLQVSCSCDTEAEMLCRHAYKAIERMIQFDRSNYFQQFRPKGLVKIATAHKKYFIIKPNAKGLDITPKEELVSIYQLDDIVQNNQFKGLLKLPGEIKLKKNTLKGMALSYIIMVSHKNRMLPFLLPCLGKLTKAENAVKVFMNFISGTQTEYDKYLGDEEKILNKCCFNMWKVVEKLPGLITPKEQTGDSKENIQMLFDIWQSIIPLLWDQRFVFTYYLHHKKELKGKPQRYKISEAHIAVKSPTLRFRLTDKGSFFQLEMKVFSNNMEITNYKLEPTFFISKGEILFFLSSLRDAAMAEWMRNIGNRMTIFKEHFTEFENRFLKPLRECYDVDLIEFKMK